MSERHCKSHRLRTMRGLKSDHKLEVKNKKFVASFAYDAWIEMHSR